jgi:hypothetical protein
MKTMLHGLLAELLPGWMKGRILERYRRRGRVHRRVDEDRA